MRKFLALFLALTMIFALCACSGDKEEKERDCGIYITMEADDVYTVSCGTDEGSDSVKNADKDKPIPVGDVLHFDIGGKYAENKADHIIDYSICIYDKDMNVINVVSFSDNFGNMAKIEITVTADHHIIHTGDSISCGGKVIVDISQTAPETGITLAVPVVSIEDNEDAEAKINAAIADLGATFLGSEKDAYKSIYDANIAAAGSGATETDFSMARTVRTERGDEAMLSFRMVDRATLANESSLEIFGVSYDAESGEELKFADLSDNTEALRSFCAEKILTATTEEERFKVENMVFNTGYTDTLSALVSDGHWYFNSEGMVIAVNPGEIAAEDSGFFEFTIPYSELDGKLDERWLPCEYDADYGCVSATNDASDLIMVGEAPEEYDFALTVTGNVYDLCVYSVNYNGGSYVLVSQLRYCSDISCGGAFPINAELSAEPSVYVAYSTADGVRHERLIAKDASGNPLIIDPNGGEGGLAIHSGYVCDLISDGSSAAIEFAPGKLTVTMGNDVFEVETSVMSKATLMLYDIDGDCEFEVFVSGDDSTGDPVSNGYKLAGELYEIISASGYISRFNGNRVTVGIDFEFAGTLPLILNYGCTYAEDGALSLAAASSTYAFDGEVKLTLKADLSANGVTCMAGTELTLKSTDAETFIDCVNAEGTALRLNISKAADGSRMIGDIPVSNLF